MLKSGGRPFWEALETSLDYGCKIWQGEEVIWVFASVGQDLWMGSRKTLLDAVEKCAPMGVMVDVPSSGPKDGIAADLRKRGYEIGLWRIRCTDYGDGVAKVKWVIVGVRNAGEVSGWQLPAATATEPNGVAKLVKSGHKTGEWLDDGWDVCLSRRISTSGERMLPWPAGHAWPRGEKAKKMLVYDIRGPSLTPRKEGTMLVADSQAPGENKGVRWLSVDEEWLLNGGTAEANAIIRQAGGTEADIKNEVMRKMPQRSAHALVSWAERNRQAATQDKVGVCPDKDRQEADRVVWSWLRAWRTRPEGPRRVFEEQARDERKAMVEEAPTHMVGGRPRKARARTAPPSAEVVPVALGRARERMVLDANRTLSKEKAWLDAMAAEVVMAKLSEGSKIGYEIGWRQWCLWRRIEGKDVYLIGEGRQARKEDEDELLRYLTYLAKVMNRAEGTIRQRLFAIKMGHVVAGYDDPTLHRTRLWAALSGFKRWQPETKRKYPVLPVMMRWLYEHINDSSDLSSKDKAVLWAALCTAFFFLLRASEYLVQNNREWSLKRVIKGQDVEGRKGNVRCDNLSEAEEIVIYLHGSKTDQFNQGAVRNHYRSGDPKLCPVEALARMQRALPDRFRGAECGDPLFRYENGAAVTREEVQGLLQLAAIADGQPASRYGSHSLRIGGATAIYMTSQDLEHVKRYGRWASSAFHNYLWESHDRQRDLARGMAGADGQLLPPRQLQAQVPRRVGGEIEVPEVIQFHGDGKANLLNSGESLTCDKGRVLDPARAERGRTLEKEGAMRSDSTVCEYFDDEDGGLYYKKQQQALAEQCKHVKPLLSLGKGGHKTIAWTHFAICQKGTCVWHQVET